MSLTPEEAHAEAVRRIEHARATNAEVLDLGDLNLEVLPKVMRDLPSLRVLALGGRQPDVREERLSWAWVSDRAPKLSDLSPMASLAHLIELDLTWCAGVADISPLAKFVNLTSLNLSSCVAVSDLSPLAALAHLTALDLSWCEKLSDLSPLSTLTNLTTLQLFECKTLSDLSPLVTLARLTTLDLEGCRAVADVSSLAASSALTTLHLSNTGVSDVLPLAALTSLTDLRLDNTAVSDLSPLANLPNLTTLHLSGCHEIRSFARLRPLLNQLATLQICNCKFIDLPIELCGHYGENVVYAARAYYADLDAGAQADSEVKLFILGNGRVGKTQLRHRLCDPDFKLDPSIPTTHGVELDRFATELDDKRTDVRVNLWDFGGQDIYHGTHALFLDGHAVFLVLWHPDFEHGEFTDPQSGARMSNRPLAYWLDYVRAQAGPDAVVVVVQARADKPTHEYPLPAVDVSGLRVRTAAVSSLTGRGLGTLREQIKEAVRDLLDARPPYQIGVGRAKVRDRLREWIEDDQRRPAAERTRRTITRDEFAALCAEIGGVSSPDALLTFLHRSGVVFSRPGLFGDRIVLDQQWALSAIYTVFDRARVLPNFREHGRFTRTDLAALTWHEYPVAEQELFLGMMRECDICFEIGERHTAGTSEPLYLAPELLPDDRDTIRRVLHGRAGTGEPALTSVARFPFLHDGVLRSVLAALGRQFRDLAAYWKWGCFLYDERADCKATLEAARGGPDDGPGGGTITVRVWGERPDQVLTALSAVVNRAAGRQEPTWTTTRAARRRVEPDVGAPRRGDEPATLTPGLPPDSERGVAISYAHGDARDDKGRNRGAFVNGLEAALTGWKYSPLRDVNELKNCGLIRQFVLTLVQNERGTPRRVVLVLSEKYLRSVYCMTELFAVYQLARGDQVVFADRVAPCVLETDLGIDDWRGRKRWTDHWKGEYAEMTAAAEDLSADDKQLWHQIGLWYKNVGDMLACVSNMVAERGYDDLTADGFAAVRRMLERNSR